MVPRTGFVYLSFYMGHEQKEGGFIHVKKGTTGGRTGSPGHGDVVFSRATAEIPTLGGEKSGTGEREAFLCPGEGGCAWHPDGNN